MVCVLALAGCSKPSPPKPPKAESLKRADELMAKGDYAHAADALRAAVEADPADGATRLRLAEAYSLTGNPQAVREAARAADQLPGDIEARALLAKLQLGQSRYFDARETAAAILQQHPDHVSALVTWAQATANIASPALALTQLDSARRSGADYERVRQNLRPLVARSDDAAAEEALRKAVRLAPADLNALIASANFFWAIGKEADSEAALKTWADGPSDAFPSRILGDFYIANNRHEEGERYLLKAAGLGDRDAKLALADHYLAVGRYKDAQSFLVGIVAAEPTAGDMVSRLANAEFRAGQRDQAIRRLDAMLAAQPNQASAAVLKADFESALGHWTDAIQWATTARKLDPTNAEAMSVLGYALVQTGQVRQGYEMLSQGLRLKPLDARLALRFAQAAILLGRGAEAVTVASSAKRRHPDDLGLTITLCRALTAVGDFSGAARELQSALNGAAPSADVLALDGRIQAGLGNAARARSALNRALAIDATHSDAVEALIELDIQQGNVPAAQLRVSQLLRDSAPSARTQWLAATVYEAAHDTQRQEAALRQALALDEGDPRATVRLAALLDSTNRQNDAEQLLQASLKSHASVPEVMSALAGHFAKAGKTDLAKAQYQRLVGLQPDTAAHKYRLAALMVERGDNLDVAMTFASDARKQAPTDPDAADVLGWVYVGKNLPSLAVPHLTDAVKLAPGRALFHYHLGFAYVRLGRTAEAEAELESSLKLDPKFDQAEKARAALEQLRRSRRS